MPKIDEVIEFIRRNRGIDLPSRQLELPLSDDAATAGFRFDDIELGPRVQEPDMSLDSPMFRDMYKAQGAYENLIKNRTSNLNNQPFAPIAASAAREARAASMAPSGASEGWKRLSAMANDPNAQRAALGVGGAAALGAGGYMMMGAPEPAAEATSPDLTDGGNNADLVEESRPAPVVEAQDEEQAFTDMFKRQYLAREAKRAATPDMQPSMEPASAPEDYSFQARELINQLNDMRRQAGGEVPEAQGMMQEINRLLAMSDNQRNAPGYQPTMPTDYHGEAQRLIQQLNDMRRKAGGEVPQAQQIMAEVRRLQAMGDRMRNAG